MKICKKCNGTGNIKVPVTEHLGSILCGMEQCDVCDGTGEIFTNFDRITESPERLAGFIKTIIDVCYTCDRDEYPQCTVCWCNPLAVKKWLNEESKE